MKMLSGLSFHSMRCLSRLLTTSASSRTPHVCVVGSGPAGFYTAQQILKGHPSVKVDIYEKLPVPFGLVRFGVAPDHPDVKNVINTFTQTARHERCRFIGNVRVGVDIRVSELQQAYSAVILSYGADADQQLGIPGEDLQGVLSARSFVGWYNGLPEHIHLNPDLSCDTAVVLGHGNVALDVARILLSPKEQLAKTDITQYAMDAISESRIRKVYIVGRRGPLQVSFTIKELREMIKLSDTRPVVFKEDFDGIKELTKDLARPRKRLTELLCKTALETPDPLNLKLWREAKNEWKLKFLRSPIQVLPSIDGKTVSGVRLGINQLKSDSKGDVKAVQTEQFEDILCGLVLRSIGYKSKAVDKDVPFDPDRGIIPNDRGRVDGCPGVYCSGWVRRGPVGVIVDTMTDGFDVGRTVLEDLSNNKLQHTGDGKDEIEDLLRKRGVQIVSFEDWGKIDQVEREDGLKKGKEREKITDCAQMLEIAAS